MSALRVGSNQHVQAACSWPYRVTRPTLRSNDTFMAMENATKAPRRYSGGGVQQHALQQKVPRCVPKFTTITKRANEHSTEFPGAIDLLLKDQAGYFNLENDRDARKARRIVQDTAASSDFPVRDDTAQSDPVLIVEEDFEDMFSDYNLGLIATWMTRSRDTSPCRPFEALGLTDPWRRFMVSPKLRIGRSSSGCDI